MEGTQAATTAALRRSCQHCRKRKIKCIPSIQNSEEHEQHTAPCKACAAKGQPCVFERQSQMGRPPKSKTAVAAPAALSSSSSSSSSSSPGSSTARGKRPLSPLDNTTTTSKKLKMEPGVMESAHFSASIPPAAHSSAYPFAATDYLVAPPSSTRTSNLSFLLNGTHHFNPYPPSSSSSASASSSSALPLPLQTEPNPRAIWIQTLEDPYPSFSNQPLLSLASAFHTILSSSASHLSATSGPALSDPSIPPIARIRTLTARATACRKPIDRSPQAATPTYARSLISPLWDGLPVDIIALTTTGKPSASGPFSISSEASKRNPYLSGPSAAHDEYLYVKLLREDESDEFHARLPDSHSPTEHSLPSASAAVFPKGSPGAKYAPDKMTVGKFFTGYFGKHPLAPLILNERLFLDDLLSNRADSLLLHIIVGSSIARAPCLGAGNDDAEDIGDEFFKYIEQELLSRRLEGASDLQACQSLMLWATHELTHMRVRRANALFSTADVLLRKRLQAFQARVEEDAAYTRMQQEGRDLSGYPSLTPLGWRDLVEQELTINSIWVIIIWNTWTSLSLKLPHNTMSVMANSIPSPPQSVALSFSFAFAYSSPEVSSPLQPVVRKTIERFSDMTQLINVIVALKNQSQARNLFTPDPPRPLAVIDDEEAQIATWLVDLAKFYHTASSSETDSQSGNSQALVPQTKVSESSRSFLVASHAVLALHQILPYATASSNAYGSPLPLPTVESLRTALTALHLVARSIQVSSPGSRTRTQAILLDAMPRILSLLDILTSSSLSSLDHFVLVTSQRNTVHQLLDDLNRAIACMSSPSARTPSLDSCGQALEKSSKGLRTVVDIGMEVHQSQQPGHNLITSMAPESTATYSALSAKLHPLAAPDTPSTPSSSADGLPWTGPSSSYTAFPNVSNGQDSLQRRPYLYHSETLQANPSFFSSSLGNSQFLTSESFSMSSHLANSPLLRSYDRTTLASPSYVGSLHAFL